MAYKQKSSPLNKGVRDAETMNTPIDNRMGNVTYGSWMSQHSKSSPLNEMGDGKNPKVTYEDAYKKRSDTYKDLNLADFTTEAKRQNTSKAEGKGWDAPKTKMTSSVSGGNTAGDISKIEEGRDLVTAGKATKKEGRQLKREGRRDDKIKKATGKIKATTDKVSASGKATERDQNKLSRLAGKKKRLEGRNKK
tara:strand:+ start:62 stop:640 length:579 start_codon:yes stop_codon:yes gene_type:complete